MDRIKGVTAFLKTLENAGIEYIFGTPGTTEVPLLDEMAGFPKIKYLLALHESIAAGMADGYARVSGKPGVVSVHTTVGTANTLGMVINAFAGDSPVIVTAGIKDSRALGTGVFLDSPFNIADLLRLYTRWAWQVLDPGNISRDTAKALYHAARQPAGPVFLAVPENFWATEVEDQVFTPPRLGALQSSGNHSEIESVAKLLAEAKRPVILAGNEVGKRQALSLVAKLAEMLSVPVYTEERLALEYLNFPTDNPLYMGTFSPGSPLLEEADVLLGLGAKMFMPFGYSGVKHISPETRVIQVHSSSEKMGLMYPAEFSLVADVTGFLKELIDILGKMPMDEMVKKERGELIHQKRSQRKSAIQQRMQSGWDRSPITVFQLTRVLSEVADADAAIVNEAITTGDYLMDYCDFPYSRAYFGYTGGCLGWGVPAAMGIKLFQPERQVIAFVGDGSFLFSVQALWTAARYNIGVKVIICNNRSYFATKSAIKEYGGKAASGKFTGTDLDNPEIDFISLARGFGVPGHRAETPRDLRPVLENALSTPGPELVEVIIEPAEK